MWTEIDKSKLFKIVTCYFLVTQLFFAKQLVVANQLISIEQSGAENKIKSRLKVEKFDLQKLKDTDLLKQFHLDLTENLIYKAYHKTIISSVFMGYCYMQILAVRSIEGRPVIKFRLEANSADWLSWFFVLKDKVTGYFDMEFSYPYYINISKVENRYRQLKEILFDYKSKKMFEESITNGKRKSNQYPLDQTIYDPYSIIYLIRRFDLYPGLTIYYRVYASSKDYLLNASVLSKEEVEVNKTRYKTLKLQLNTKVQGALAQRKGIWIYFTEDKAHVPVMIEADVKIGKFVLELQKF